MPAHLHLAPRGPLAWIRRAVGQLSPLDRLTATYACCATLILVARMVTHAPWGSTGQPGWLLLANVLLLALVFLAATARRRVAPRHSVVAEWYPLLVILALYGSIGLLNGPRQELGLSYDSVLLRWEGIVPAQLSLERWGGHPGSRITSWGLGLAYLAFFPMVVAAPLGLWLQGRHEHARRAIFGITLTFFACYLLFLLFPVAGPAYSLGWPESQSALDTPVRLVRELNDHGDSWGSAFPSSHVAASLAAMLFAMTGCRRLGTILLPVALGILLAVVYFRVHYVLDAVAGVLVAVAAAWIVGRHWRLGGRVIADG